MASSTPSPPVTMGSVTPTTCAIATGFRCPAELSDVGVVEVVIVIIHFEVKQPLPITAPHTLTYHHTHHTHHTQRDISDTSL